MTNAELWQAVLGEMELSLSKAQFITWFKNTNILSNQNGKVTIGVPNGFAKEWLENKFNLHILQSLRRFEDSIQEISCVICAEDGNPEEQNASHTESAHMPGPPMPQMGNAGQVKSEQKVEHDIPYQSKPSSIISRSFTSPIAVTPTPTPPSVVHVSSAVGQTLNLNPRYTFENFIVGENNELARAACYAASQNLGNLYNPLFIYGGVGLGKTHLLQSIGNEVMKKYPEKRIKYVDAERFTSELIDSIKNQKVDKFKEDYQQADLLIVDDVQFLSGREKTQDEFFHIFNTLYQVNKQIVISSDRPPQSIPTIEDRLRSRFQGGMIADISRPNLETRMAILRTKIAEKHFHLEDDAIRFIAENITNNIRELEGALNRVIASCEFHKIVPSISYIKKILGTIISHAKKHATPEHIMKTVAEFYHIEEADLTRKIRKKEIAHPRQVAMWLMRTELKMSFASIGKHFGGRDHTTTLHASEKIQKDLEEDLQLKDEINNLKEVLYKE